MKILDGSPSESETLESQSSQARRLDERGQLRLDDAFPFLTMVILTSPDCIRLSIDSVLLFCTRGFSTDSDPSHHRTSFEKT